MLTNGPFPQIVRVTGALRSKNRAAYLGIALNALKPFTKPIDKMFSVSSVLQEHTGKDIPSCIMVVSPPRSGSTIIYQALVRAIPSIYISNLHTIFPRHATTYIIRRNRALSVLKNNSNYYGYTPSLCDVNEGNEFVDALFRHGESEISIRNNFLQLISTVSPPRNVPFIFKNVRAYSQILLLHRAVPELIFLRIKRDVEQIIQSVVRAYNELGTFHPIPNALKNLSINDPIEFAVRQILEIESTIDLQKVNIRDANWLEWHYEDFCENPWTKMENLVESYLQLPASCLRNKNLLGSLNASYKMKVTPQEVESIKEILSRLWREKMHVNEVPKVSRDHAIADNG